MQDIDERLTALVLGAVDGDRSCWDALVARFGGLVWSVARSFRMTHADAAEVSQMTWLHLAEHLDRIQHPERLGAWLVTTARHECLRQRRLQARQALGPEHELERHAEPAPSAEVFVLREERDSALYCAFAQLPERSRTLLAMLLNHPPISYSEISEALGIPIGSIGPTRARVLATLRRHVEAAGVSAYD